MPIGSQAVLSLAGLLACGRDTSFETVPTDSADVTEADCPDLSEVQYSTADTPVGWDVTIEAAAQPVLGTFTGTARFQEEDYDAVLVSETSFEGLSVRAQPLSQGGELTCLYVVRMSASLSLYIDGLVQVTSEGHPTLSMQLNSNDQISIAVYDEIPWSEYLGSPDYSPAAGYPSVSFNNDPRISDTDLLHVQLSHQNLSFQVCRGEAGCP